MSSTYDTRTMLEAVRELPPSPLFLKNTFFPADPPLTTEIAEVDVVKGSQRMAPFVSPIQEGVVVAREGFRAQTLRPPYIKLKIPTTPFDATMRMPGEIVYSTTTPAQRAADKMASDLLDLRGRIDRRIEWMAAQALFYGGIHAVDDDAHKEFHINFGRSATNNIILAGDAVLSHESKSVFPLLRHMKRMVAAKSGMTADVCILGSSVVDVFLDNETVQKRLDLTRLNVGAINVQQMGPGVTYWGYFADPGLDVYSYDVTYSDKDGEVHEMVPDDMIFVGASGVGKLLFAAIRDLDGLFATDYFSKSWTEPDPSTAWVLMQTSPLTVPYYVNAYVGAHVLGTGGPDDDRRDRFLTRLKDRFGDKLSEYEFRITNATVYDKPFGSGAKPIMDGKLDLEKHFLNDLVLDNGWITPTLKATIKDTIIPDRQDTGYAARSPKPDAKKE